MSDIFYSKGDLETISRAATALNNHLISDTSEDCSFSGEVHVVDINGERLGTFYSIGDDWNFYPLYTYPETREVSTDAKAALERLYALRDKGKGLTYDELFEILPVLDA